MPRGQRFWIETLGCPKNQVDSDKVVGTLTAEGLVAAARPEALDWDRAKYPGTFQALDNILVIAWNERYTEEHVRYIADAISGGVERLRK